QLDVAVGGVVIVLGILDVVVGGGHVHLDVLHGAVQENGGSGGRLDRQVGAVAVKAGDEHVVLGALEQVDAQEVAVLVEIHVVGVVGQQVGVVLIEDLVV